MSESIRTDNDKLALRLRQLAHAIAKGDKSELSMRVPADRNRDADIVLSSAAERIEELQSQLAQRWMPIETAPKDGTWVLLAFPSESMIAKWLDNSESRIPAALWVVPSMIIRPKGEPTHWQPLPTPPDQQEESS